MVKQYVTAIFIILVCCYTIIDNGAQYALRKSIFCSSISRGACAYHVMRMCMHDSYLVDIYRKMRTLRLTYVRISFSAKTKKIN